MNPTETKPNEKPASSSATLEQLVDTSRQLVRQFATQTFDGMQDELVGTLDDIVASLSKSVSSAIKQLELKPMMPIAIALATGCVAGVFLANRYHNKNAAEAPLHGSKKGYDAKSIESVA